MSAADAPPPPLTFIIADAAAKSSSSSSSSSSSFALNFNSIGIGYAIAIALGFFVLFSTILLASYICCRSAASRRNRREQAANRDRGGSDENSVYLPRVIFVAEEDDLEAQNVVVGLDQAVINSYPKLVFSKRNGKLGNETLCSICLCEYRESEVLRMLPDCSHVFHVMCVDAWLKLNASCPVCRNSPLPTPVSTPLQEVVPLSQYADGRRRR